MAIEVLGGDFSGIAAIGHGTLWTGPRSDKFEEIGFSNPQTVYSRRQLKRMKQLDAESAKSFVGTALASGVGAFLLGPVGLIAGGLAGGRTTREVYGLEFSDGKKAIIREKARDPALQCLKLYAQELRIFESNYDF